MSEQRYRVRAHLDEHTCAACRAANGSYTLLIWPLLDHCHHVANGTGICRCVVEAEPAVPAAPIDAAPFIASRPEIGELPADLRDGDTIGASVPAVMGHRTPVVVGDSPYATTAFPSDYTPTAQELQAAGFQRVNMLPVPPGPMAGVDAFSFTVGAQFFIRHASGTAFPVVIAEVDGLRLTAKDLAGALAFVGTFEEFRSVVVVHRQPGGGSDRAIARLRLKELLAALDPLSQAAAIVRRTLSQVEKLSKKGDA
jgi:hypothetical protein